MAGARLSDVASTAFDITPAEIVKAWLSGLSPTAARSYRLSLSTFGYLAIADPGSPAEDALRVLLGPAAARRASWRLADGLGGIRQVHPTVNFTDGTLSYDLPVALNGEGAGSVQFGIPDTRGATLTVTCPGFADLNTTDG